MIPLATQGEPQGLVAGIIGRVTFNSVPQSERRDTVKIVDSLSENDDLFGYAAIITKDRTGDMALPVPAIRGCTTDHLGERDIVAISRRGYVRTVIRHGSPS